MKNQWDDAVCSAGFSFRGGEIIDKIIHCADLGIFDKYLILPFVYDILFLGKKYCRVHDWSQKRKPPVLPHWGFSIPFLEQEN